jgi:putative transposase
VRAVGDAKLKEITRVYKEHYSVYGAAKIWRQLKREGVMVGRDRVARLMRELGISGVVRGKTRRTTVADLAAARAPDLVQRRFVATRPNQLWMADLERHEVLFDRAVMRGHRRRPVAAGWLKLRAA